jgi:hypothetical protein
MGKSGIVGPIARAGHHGLSASAIRADPNSTACFVGSSRGSRTTNGLDEFVKGDRDDQQTDKRDDNPGVWHAHAVLGAGMKRTC